MLTDGVAITPKMMDDYIGDDSWLWNVTDSWWMHDETMEVKYLDIRVLNQRAPISYTMIVKRYANGWYQIFADNTPTKRRLIHRITGADIFTKKGTTYIWLNVMEVFGQMVRVKVPYEDGIYINPNGNPDYSPSMYRELGLKHPSENEG